MILCALQKGKCLLLLLKLHSLDFISPHKIEKTMLNQIHNAENVRGRLELQQVPLLQEKKNKNKNRQKNPTALIGGNLTLLLFQPRGKTANSRGSRHTAGSILLWENVNFLELLMSLITR